MTKVFEHFFITFFCLCGFILVAVNFTWWGSFMVGTGEPVHNDSFFGFQSFLSFINFFTNTFVTQSSGFNLMDLFKLFMRFATFNASGVVNEIANFFGNLGNVSGWQSVTDFLGVLAEVFYALLSPFLVLLDVVFIGIYFLIILITFTYSLGMAIGGFFNTSWADNPPLYVGDFVSNMKIAFLQGKGYLPPFVSALGYKGANLAHALSILKI